MRILVQATSLLLYWAALIAIPFVVLAVPMLVHAETTKLTMQDIQHAIAQSLEQDGIGEKVRVDIPSGALHQAMPEYSSEAKVFINSLNLDKEHQRFDAVLVFELDGRSMAPVKVAGRYEPLKAVPMLTRPVKNGQVIGEDDIAMTDVVESRIPKGAITQKSELVGKTALRLISPKRIIRTEELAMPAAVVKGTAVTIRYNAKNLEITGSGEALDSGAVGDMVRVRNRDSKKIVQGLVRDAHTVEIIAAGSIDPTPAAAPAPQAPRPALELKAPTATAEPAVPAAAEPAAPLLPAEIPDTK